MITLVIAALCGVIAQFIVGFTRGGLLFAFVVGIVGALVGARYRGFRRRPSRYD